MDRGMARDYVGGFGINQRLAYDLIRPEVEALDPANPIIFAAGVLGGTTAPASSKVMATTKFPITGAIGTPFGGTTGDALKHAGYGHAVVTGRADRPVVLSLHDDDVELLDASHVWGRDIHETTDMLREEYGNRSSVIAIGPAGEKLAPISFAYANKMGHLGQGGLGAVMGAKNLKAILIRGTKGVEVADRRAFSAAADRVYRALTSLNYREDYIRIGPTIASWGRSAARPKLTPQQEAAAIYGPAQYDKRWRATQPCPGCPIGCKFLLELREGDHAGELAITTGYGASWEQFNVGSMDRTLELHDFCNRQGLDDSTVTAIIDLVITLYENGVITGADCDGLELQRDYATAKALVYKIARRDGVGELLGEGYAETLRAFGPDAERFGETFKDRHISDPRRRHFQAMTLEEIVNPRGYGSIGGLGPSFMPNHPVDTFRRYLSRLGLTPEHVDRIVTDDTVNLARMLAHSEQLQTMYNCLGTCARQPVGQCYDQNNGAELYTAATGFRTEPQEMLQLADKAWNLYKMVNVREGFTRADERFPDKWMNPMEKGGKSVPLTDYYGHPLGREDLETMLDDYYDERGWDATRGVPTPERLEEHGLGFTLPILEALP